MAARVMKVVSVRVYLSCDKTGRDCETDVSEKRVVFVISAMSRSDDLMMSTIYEIIIDSLFDLRPADDNKTFSFS